MRRSRSITYLVNLHGELRFCSGYHAITMEGTSPDLTTARISQKAPIDCFFASVRCHPRPQCAGGAQVLGHDARTSLFLYVIGINNTV